jgi:tetrahydromethanopterin S-methyltransferase subunit G
MGFIEGGRQLIQDFVTPEIRSLDARLTAVEKRLESLDAKVEKRFDSVECKMERNQAQVLDTLHRMENYSHLLERLARVESKLQNVAWPLNATNFNNVVQEGVEA